jgi:hypothetical protein
MWVGNSVRRMRVESGSDFLGGRVNAVCCIGPDRARIFRTLVRIVPRILAGALLLCLSVAAQSPGLPQPGLDHGQSSARFPTQTQDEQPQVAPEIEAKRIKALNQMRHKAMIDDATHLLALARELNDDTANLSPGDRLRKAGEIEKLAKSVKEKMSYSVGGNEQQLFPVYTVTKP